MSARGILIVVAILIVLAGVAALYIWAPAGPPQQRRTEVRGDVSVHQVTRIVLLMTDTEGLSRDEVRTQLNSTIRILSARCDEQFPDRPPTIIGVEPDTIIAEFSGILDCSLARSILARQGRMMLQLASQREASEEVLGRIDSVVAAQSSIGARDPHPFTSLLRRQPVPSLWCVWGDDRERITRLFEREDVAQVIPDAAEFLWDSRSHRSGDREYHVLYFVERTGGVNGSHVIDASPDVSSVNSPAVAFQLSPDGGTQLSRLTASGVGRYLAIVVDGCVESAPLVRAPIEHRGLISLGEDASPQDADILTLLLRHKPCPRPLTMIECSLVKR